MPAVPGEKLLRGVHPDLVRVVRRANELAPGTFRVIEGVRTGERQRQLVKSGASRTMRSRHIPSTSKRAPHLGHAVDLAAVVGGKIRWDWPLYPRLAKVVKRAAKEVGVPLEWGGDWPTFRDGPHWQLPWSSHP
jgi:peptidoglycan LD-endopeptidase CwlK